jgi:hypothetical protein
MVAEEHADGGRPGGFDPRFDPAFQRGYQPRPGERPQTRVRSDAPDAGYRQPSSLLPARDERPPAADPLAAVEAAVPFDDGPAAQVAGTVAAAPESWTVVEPAGRWGGIELNPRRNPFVLALWLVGAGCVVLGILLYCVSVVSSYNGPTPSTDVGALVFAQLGWMFAGPLITVGLLTLVGLLFLSALANRGASRQGAPPDEED